MKYFTLALIMVAPCLAQASQYVTGILTDASNEHYWIQEVATDLPNCKTVDDVQANSAECLQGRTIEVIVPGPDLGNQHQAEMHIKLEAELQRLTGSLVRLTGNFNPFFGTRVIFNLSLYDAIQTIASPQAPEPCGNYNGVCH